MAIFLWMWVVALVWLGVSTWFAPPSANPSADTSPTPSTAVSQPARIVADPSRSATAPTSVRPTKKLSSTDLLAAREELDRTLWAPELLSQQYEAVLIRLWDRLRAAQDPWAILEQAPVSTIHLGRTSASQTLEHDIVRTRMTEPLRALSPKGWAATIHKVRSAGMRLAQSEWQHLAFQPANADSGQPARSTVAMKLFVTSVDDQFRAVVSGDLDVEWSDQRDAEGLPRPTSITARELTILSRTGPPAFREWEAIRAEWEARELRKAEPMLLADVNRDGLPDLILSAMNTVRINRGGGKFEVQPLRPGAKPSLPAAIIADFDGDGLDDLLHPALDARMYLHRGQAGGKFATGTAVTPKLELAFAVTLTAGDVDEDGDLDVFLGQYRLAFHDGQMPTPYFDSLDGHPAYLLLNDGRGNFTDATAQSGLEAKRRRRTFSATLVDINGDRHLDLVVTSDYAGVDVYLGDGQGMFRDVTSQYVPQRHAFGSSHAFGDFDGDRRLDVFVAARWSPAAQRLNQLGLHRDDRVGYAKMRGVMGQGNVMLLSRDGQFASAAFRQQIANTGWPWGCATLDVDNDGDDDLFVNNGHSSGKSVRDYDSTYWRHDLYTGGSQPDASVALLFQTTMEEYNQQDISWCGRQHKALLMNRGGREFVDIAHLLGLAFEFDGRAVVSGDLDLDGRVDLIVTEKNVIQRSAPELTLHVLRNELPRTGHWIGVRLYSSGPGKFPQGATVTLVTPQGRRTTPITTGDGLLCQHAPIVHFGLGRATRVDAIEVRWPNGQVDRIDRPAIDRYHDLPVGRK